jgi:hypothetical protein
LGQSRAVLLEPIRQFGMVREWRRRCENQDYALAAMLV